MNQQSNPFTAPDGKKSSCMQMLQTILDGAATQEQKEYFTSHMDRCMPCFKTYEVDIAIKDMLKRKCCGEEISREMVEELKDMIKNKIAS